MMVADVAVLIVNANGVNGWCRLLVLLILLTVAVINFLVLLERLKVVMVLMYAVTLVLRAAADWTFMNLVFPNTDVRYVTS